VIKAPSSDKTVLVVVDKTHASSIAARYASRHAAQIGAELAMLYVIEPEVFGGALVQMWQRMDSIFHAESRLGAEGILAALTAKISRTGGKAPTTYVRQGNRAQQVIKLVTEEKRISAIVLAATVRPNPLIPALSAALKVPITIVPGSLTDEDVDALA
jgi:nucleotide-binding universal stress UspA family protein